MTNVNKSKGNFTKPMKIRELLNLISQKTENPVNQSILAKSLGITRQNISNRVRNNSEITLSEIQKIEEFFGIKLFEACPQNIDMIDVDYYPEVFASCGHGTITFSEEKHLISIPKSLLFSYSPTKKYSMIHAYGDSMTPFINNDDKLIIEHLENNQIIDNKIYVFCYKSEIFVKRLSKNLDEIIIKSDNPNYGQKTIQNEEINEINIIGQVIGIMRSL